MNETANNTHPGTTVDNTHVGVGEATAKAGEPIVTELPPASPAPWHLREPITASLLVANLPLIASVIDAKSLWGAAALGAVNGALVWARSKVTPTRDPKLATDLPLRVPEDVA